MGFPKYTLLQQSESSPEKETSSRLCSPVRSCEPCLKRNAPLLIVLFVSLGFNAFLLYLRLKTQSDSLRGTPTEYAGLLRNVAVPFTIDKVFDSGNQTVSDEAWRSPELVPETGLVAMPNDWVFSKGLPEAQRFPWDKSKGLYVLNGFHNMHCLVS
ncbi:hypothetical protein MMC11_005098 [Xylographa trunciseda]|nr:hypothetical protein [Xylographa trunciseda]